MKIGTIGSGFIVNAFIDGVRKDGGAEVTACYSRSEQTAKDFAAKSDIGKWYTDADAFINDSELDFIYVASPNSLHYNWTKQALLAGKNVICEKPFTSTAAELEELVKLARDRGLFLFEALTVAHLPNYKLLKTQLGEIGRIRMLQLNYSQYSSRYDAYLRGENPNVFNPEYSGGALMDLNYYNVNFVLGLFGKPQNAVYYPNMAENGLDISGVLIMQYDGFTVTSTACKDSASRSFAMIQGEKGYIEVHSPAGIISEGYTIHTKQGETHYHEQKEENALYYEAADFIAAYKAGDPSACDARLEEGLVCMRLLDDVRRKAGIIFPADKQEKA